MKGQQVNISGELRTNEYQAKDGTTKTSIELNANILDLVGSKREGQAPAPKQQAPANDLPYDDFDDSIPF